MEELLERQHHAVTAACKHVWDANAALLFLLQCFLLLAGEKARKGEDVRTYAFAKRVAGSGCAVD